MRPQSKELFVYKVCSRGAWRDALERGELGWSEDDVRDGFMHLSTREQLSGTLSRHFTGQKELLLLVVPTSLLAEHLRWELSRGGQRFPHWYASLPTSFVSEVHELEFHDQGHRLPPGV